MKVIQNIIVTMLMMICVLFRKKETAKPTRFKYRLVIYCVPFEFSERICYQLQKRKLLYWKDLLGFTDYDLNSRHLLYPKEEVDGYIKKELGYLPRYAVDEYPHFPSDRIRKFLARRLIRLARKLDEKEWLLS